MTRKPGGDPCTALLKPERIVKATLGAQLDERPARFSTPHPIHTASRPSQLQLDKQHAALKLTLGLRAGQEVNQRRAWRRERNKAGREHALHSSSSYCWVCTSIRRQ